MKMLISPTSPYARKARILVAEKNYTAKCKRSIRIRKTLIM